MEYPIKQSGTSKPLLLLMVDSTDHVSPKTGLTPTVTISKNGAAFASPAGAVTEIGSGWYKVAGNATDTNTLGPLLLHATGAGADPTDVSYSVVAFDPDDAVHLGLSALPNAAAAASGGLPTGDASGRVLLQPSQPGVTIPTVTALTNGVTVTTNNDKTGYGLTQAFPANFSALTITGGKVDVNDKTGFGLATSQSFNNTGQTADLPASVAAYAAGQDPAELVLGAAAGNWDVANTIGAKINTAAAGGGGGGTDPWSIALPGSYGSGTAGKLLSDASARITTALPSAAPGASGGLPTSDASNGVKVSVGTGTGQIALTSGKIDVSDKTGFTAAASNLPTDYARNNVAPSWYAAPDNADIVTALADLVTLLGRTDPTTALTSIKSVTDRLNTMLEQNGPNYRLTVAALVNAPGGSGSGGGASVDDIIDGMEGAGFAKASDVRITVGVIE